MFFALIGLGFLASILTPWGGYILLTALSVFFFAGVSAMLALGTTMALEPLPKTAGMAAALLGTYQLTLGALVASLISSLGFESLYVLQIVLMALGFLIFGLSRLAKKAGYALPEVNISCPCVIPKRKPAAKRSPAPVASTILTAVAGA